VAKRLLDELKKEQKDVGKLKNANEKLKQEMASLRAMLASQAKESAANKAHAKEIAEKEERIAELEKRIIEIEKELEAARKTVEKLEADLEKQQSEAFKDKEEMQKLRKHRPALRSSGSGEWGNVSAHHQRSQTTDGTTFNASAVPADYVSPEVLAAHRARVATLEEELEAERKFRREADGEIIRLRAHINGVELNDADVNALLARKLEGAPGLRSEAMSEESSFAGDEPDKRYVVLQRRRSLWHIRWALIRVLFVSSCRYMLFILLLVTMLMLFCAVPLLRRRSFVRVSLQMIEVMKSEIGSSLGTTAFASVPFGEFPIHSQ
jgi:hypothetical protein